MKDLTDELKEILCHIQDAADNMDITKQEAAEAKAALLEDAAMEAELVTE